MKADFLHEPRRVLAAAATVMSDNWPDAFWTARRAGGTARKATYESVSSAMIPRLSCFTRGSINAGTG